MTPELKVLILAGAVIAFAYTVIYPKMPVKTLNRMMVLDLGVTAALLLVVGLAYFGTATAFSLVFCTVPWWAFTFIAAFCIEVPFFIWFCKRWNIDIMPPPDL